MRARPSQATRRRFVSLRSNEVNVRVGPGVRYPIKWKFRQKLIPVEVVQEYDTWRKIRDWEGAEGWVHKAMLWNRRSIIVTGRGVTLRRRSSDDAPAVARLAGRQQQQRTSMVVTELSPGTRAERSRRRAAAPTVGASGEEDDKYEDDDFEDGDGGASAAAAELPAGVQVTVEAVTREEAEACF